VRTFSSYFDLIIMRSEIGGLAERVAWLLSNSERPVPVINAGSGKDQHPTQALLDIYTLQRSFETRGGIDGKRIVFAGDLKRGRTVRRSRFCCRSTAKWSSALLRLTDSRLVKIYRRFCKSGAYPSA
jgi:aspartate carbamoyltransferase catalytic subunit